MLIADADRTAAESLAIVLRTMGYDVCLVHDGVEAETIAQVFRPHVAVIDIGIPGLDPHAFARRIRAEPWGWRVLLIAVTAWNQFRDWQRADDAGFDHHCVRPLDASNLQAMLDDARYDW
jgi:DNA-binding response OmpR family regulator